MIFSELYGAYYRAVAAVLTEALSHPLSDGELRAIVEKHAFGESVSAISSALKDQRWPLLKPDGTTPLKNVPSIPLSLLQKRWLKAVACDPRIGLFYDDSDLYPGVEPLFRPTDVIFFDKYSDGDDFMDPNYIATFRLILDAIRKKHALRVETLNRKGKPVRRIIVPEYLEYSEKDDKFRLIGAGSRSGITINLGRILSCAPSEKLFETAQEKGGSARPRCVAFELVDRRNALERVLLHFAHFKKTAEKIDDERYRVTVNYDKEDETELVIRILSFGPLVKVTSPPHFVNLIKQRLANQKSCGHF
ncbi:MAG: WYL domain-containing protein [Pyramidobacter sp.]|jgi:hypothetical protein